MINEQERKMLEDDAKFEAMLQERWTEETWYLHQKHEGRANSILNRTYKDVRVKGGVYQGYGVRIDIGPAENWGVVDRFAEPVIAGMGRIPIKGKQKYRIISIKSGAQRLIDRVKRRLRKGGVTLTRCTEKVAA